VRHPEAFHGAGVTKEFFEGWYIKLGSVDLSQRRAVIPGIFRGLGSASGTDTRDEAFVQVLDGVTGRAWYHRYDVSEFEISSCDCGGCAAWLHQSRLRGVHSQ
jgi:hypothetical protein